MSNLGTCFTLNEFHKFPQALYDVVETYYADEVQNARARNERVVTPKDENLIYIRAAERMIRETDAAIGVLRVNGTPAVPAAPAQVAQEPVAEPQEPAPQADRAATQQTWETTYEQDTGVKWADLTEAEMSTLDQAELDGTMSDAAMDIEAARMAGPKFSKAPVKASSQAAQVLSEIKKLLRLDSLNAKVTVVQSVGDLPAGIQKSVNVDDQTQGFVYQGKAYLVADNIAPGKARSVFLHEVGAHLGLERLLGKDQYKALVNQIKKWADRNDGSQESKLAKAAQQRVVDAETAADQTDTELVAYFIEEAVDAGVDPTAMSANTEFGRWFRSLWAAFKRAVHKLGINPDKLTARDVVDMAYGAAKLESTGAFHGAAAQFRKFDHKYMGTGEGAQAFGWGSYFAQAPGIAKGYFKTDVRNKTQPTGYAGTKENFVPYIADLMDRGLSFSDAKGMMIKEAEDALARLPAGHPSRVTHEATIKRVAKAVASDYPKSKPEGALYRTDFNIQDDEWLDLDKPLSEQSEKVKAALGRPSDVLKLVQEHGNNNLTGRGIYTALEAKHGSDKAASEYLDSIGIKGNKFLDANSRGNPGNGVQYRNGVEVPRAHLNVLWDINAVRLDHDTNEFQLISNSEAVIEAEVARLQEAGEPVPEAIRAAYARGLEDIPIPRTSNFVVFNDKNIQRVASLKAADRERVQFSKATTAPIRSGNIHVDALPGMISRAWGGLKHLTTKGALNLMLTDDLIEQTAKVVPAAVQYMKAMSEINVTKTRQEQHVADILTMFKALPMNEQGTKGFSVNALIKASTMAQKWAFKPDWLKEGEHTEIDPALKEWFDTKLSDKGREVVKAVFKHGHESLAEMQKAATESANSEFDVLIKAANDEGDTTEAARLTKLKQKELTDFQTLFAQRSAWPYAPLRRFGNHVVMGMSARYIAARENKDVKEMRELESNGDHYYVAFAETKQQAEAMLAKISGSFPDGETGTFEKLDQADSMLGGRDMLSALRRFRNMAMEEGDTKTDARVKDLTRKLYLMLLAENSARKGELNRRNIAGADEDMMRSFASNGRATAHFIASLKTGGKVDESLQEMRSQVRKTLNGRDKRQMYFNEVMRRHSMSLTYQSNGLVDSTLAMTSGYMLLSNPSYFLINATQPWMMSLPMLAGKHTMTKAAPELLKAYRGMAAVLKDGKLDGSDYALLPADVRDMVKKLADQGVISIELSHDMGSFRSNPDSKVGDVLATVTDKVRGAAQSVETLNRLTTAIAAIRLEKAKGSTDEQAVAYAGKLITDTHGNYTGFNAPRFMRTDIGRVATQFRKFQLVQLTMFAKLLSQAFSKSKSEERSIAWKALAFNLGTLAATGGMTAMPGFVLASWILGKVFGDEDEPEDLRAKITREYGKPMADLLWGGLSQKAGVPLGGRLGAGGMLSLLPYTDIEMSRDGYANVAIGLAGPTIGGVLPRMWEGVGMAASGDVWKGMEQMAPTGIANLSKTLRFQAQGLTQRNGDVVLSNDEIGLLDTVLQGVGLAPNTIADRNWLAGAKFEADKFYNERTTALKRQYADAVMSNDAEAISEARKDWMSTQAARRELGYKVQPLSELLKAPQERRKREAATRGGVQYGEANAGFVEGLT